MRLPCFIFVLIALGLLAFTPAEADPPPVRFEINFGAYIPQLDTNIRLDGSNGLLGVELDFEEDFNLDNATVTPLVECIWQMSKKHGLSLVGFNLERASVGESTISFRFGDEVFPVGVPLEVEFDTNVLAVTYAYKFFNNHKRSFGMNFGLNTNQIRASIRSTEGVERGAVGDVTAPLPTIGVNGHVMLSKRWKFYATIGAFALRVGDYQGVLTAVQGGFIHETFKNVGFGVGVYGFNVRVDSDNEDFLGRIETRYNGLVGYLNLRFGGTATKARAKK